VAKGLSTRVSVAVGAGIGLVLSYALMAPHNSAQICASYLVYPVLVMQRTYIEPLKNVWAQKRTVQELETRVAQLEQQKDDLTAQLIQLQASVGYAHDSKELVEFRQRYASSYATIAQVIIKHISDQEHSFLIGAGSYKGVQKDMVAVYKNHLIGRVVQVYPLYSKVLLITDRSCKVASYCVQTGATGIYTGCNQPGKSALHHVSHLMAVKEGDMVLSSGEGLIFPRGFALGTIKTAVVNGLLYDVTCEPLLDVRTLKYCYVVQKGSECLRQESVPCAVAPKATSVSDENTVIISKASEQKSSVAVADKVPVVGPVSAPAAVVKEPVPMNNAQAMQDAPPPGSA
jgi:rod shape-determining protein MreC